MRTSSPMVSVIMPVYDSAEYLAEAVESILTQTLQDFELLAIDDGSTDGSAQILDSYTDKRVRVLHQENSGIVAPKDPQASATWLVPSTLF